MNGIIQDTRKDMQFHRHPIHRSFQVMKPDVIIQFELLGGIFNKLLSTCLHPNINITRSTRIRLWIHQGITLAFQYTAPKSIIPQHREELTGHHIHLHVLPANLLRLTHPGHQQIPIYRILLQLIRLLLPKSFNTIETKSKQNLLGSKRKQ